MHMASPKFWQIRGSRLCPHHYYSPPSFIPSYGSVLWISAETDAAGILLMRAPDYYIRSDSPASPLSASQFSDQSVQGV